MEYQQAYDEWKALIKQERELKARKRELREKMLVLPRPKNIRISGYQTPNMARNQDMAKLYESGKTLQEIGDLYGITRERVRQILKRLDIKPRQAKRNQPCKAYGCNNLANGAKGYCRLHYSRLRQKGNVGDPEFKSKTLTCAVEGCGLPYKSNGLCNKHRLNFYYSKRRGAVTDLNDYLKVQKAKRMMGKHRAIPEEIRKFMADNPEHFTDFEKEK